MPGVKYTKSETEDWTWVIKRSQRRKKPQTVDSSDYSGSELDVSCSRKVEYTVHDGVPGVIVYCRNIIILWKAIKPSPIATRTRSKINK